MDSSSDGSDEGQDVGSAEEHSSDEEGDKEISVYSDGSNELEKEVRMEKNYKYYFGDQERQEAL